VGEFALKVVTRAYARLFEIMRLLKQIHNKSQ